MTTLDRYALPVEQTGWPLPSEFESLLRWEYDDARPRLHALYEKGKSQQWNGADRIDWSQDLDPENPQGMPDEAIMIHGTELWERLTAKERANLRRHAQAYQLSQFLHGEQGALLCSAKIVQQVPRMDAKFYAATQVMDEARHVEVYSRLLHEKFELAFPITRPLRSLLEDVITDSRWDITYLGMQVLIEGLALAAFASIRDMAKNPLAASVNAYVMQDEARHVAFGRIALRDYYPQLSDAERDEREEFAVEASYLMRDRFKYDEVWQAVGLPVDDCIAIAETSERMRQYRTRLFSRIVPTIKDIGLWGPRIRKAYADMGVLGYADVDPDALLAKDQAVAEEFDARRGR
jgi:para-aminobenzoate N-oxygenase AurF